MIGPSQQLDGRPPQNEKRRFARYYSNYRVIARKSEKYIFVEFRVVSLSMIGKKTVFGWEATLEHNAAFSTLFLKLSSYCSPMFIFDFFQLILKLFVPYLKYTVIAAVFRQFNSATMLFCPFSRFQQVFNHFFAKPTAFHHVRSNSSRQISKVNQHLSKPLI